jgi:hypothetical protein
MKISFTPAPDDDTAAAIAAAIACLVEQEQLEVANTPAVSRSTWSAAGTLAAHGLPSVGGATHAAWASAERAGREGRWTYGIVGL